jgi:hypothetical protein
LGAVFFGEDKVGGHRRWCGFALGLGNHMVFPVYKCVTLHMKAESG